MTHPNSRIAFDAPEYDAGYEEGFAAWQHVDPEMREGEPPEHLTEGFSAGRRDGFRDAWGDAMVAAET